MFAVDDTIVAIATPEGRGGIGVVRVSGPQSVALVMRLLSRRRGLEPRRATTTRIVFDAVGSVTDRVVVTWFPSPRSYTGEDVVEVSAHGSPVVLNAVVRRLVESGARLALPGEFTLRAFLNGRQDLIQAEAVADLINAATPLQARVACDQLEGSLSEQIAAVDRTLLDLVASLEASLDFPEEGFHFIEPGVAADRIGHVVWEIERLLDDAGRGRVIREGATVVIAGRTNVGKSSLFNALLGRNRAIVTEVAGTTRDLLTEKVDMDGLAITLVDTAGVRDTHEAIEREGVERAVRARSQADLTMLVLDSGEELNDEDLRLLEGTRDKHRLLVASKSDRRSRWQLEGPIAVSTHPNFGIESLRCAIVAALTGGERLRDTPQISNLRHVQLLADVRMVLNRARTALVEEHAPEEFVLVDLHHARSMLAEVVGPGADGEVLDHIFKNFCVGK